MGFMSTMPALGGDQPQGPQMGFGLDPATGLPFGQDPMQQQNFGDGMQTQPMPMQQPQAQLQPLPAGLPTVGMGGGKGMPAQIAPQMGNMPNAGLNPAQQLPQGPQMGFGMPPSGGYNSPVRTQLPQQATMQPAPMNRFAPPNAPGVRTAPRSYTRTRTR